MLSPQGKAAEQALTALESAVLSARRHGREHRTAQKGIDAALAGLESYADEYQSLSVAVRKHGLIVADEVALGGEDDPCELMRLLLPDRISQFSFDPPTARDDLEALVGVLAEHCPVAGRTGDLVEAILVAEEGKAPSEQFFRRLQRSVTPSSDPLDWSCLPERARAFLESEPGAPRRKLLERLPATEADDRARAGEVLEWSSKQPDHAPEPVEAGRFLAAMAARSLAEGDVAGAADALSRVYDLGQADEVRRVVTHALGSRGALELAARALRSQQEIETDELIHLGLSYFRHLDDQAVEPTCRLYPTLANSDVRRVFRRFLTSRVATHAKLIEGLTRVPEEAIVTEAIGILALGKKDSLARKLLEQAAEGEQQPRRRLALEALDVVTGERKRRELGQILAAGDDRRERLSAIKLFKADGSSRAFEELAKVVSSAEFVQRDEEEAQLAFDALTELGGLRAVRVLQDITKRKSGLFGRKQSEQLKQIAHAWLQRLKGKR